MSAATKTLKRDIFIILITFSKIALKDCGCYSGTETWLGSNILFLLLCLQFFYSIFFSHDHFSATCVYSRSFKEMVESFWRTPIFSRYWSLSCFEVVLFSHFEMSFVWALRTFISRSDSRGTFYCANSSESIIIRFFH